MRIAISSSILVVALLFSLDASAELPFNESTVVKRSTSGICHPPGTRNYNQTKTFYQLELKDCLAGGSQSVTNQDGATSTETLEPGRLPVYLQTAWLASQNCKDGASAACSQAAVAEDKAREEAKQLDRFVGFRFGIGLSAMNFGQQSIDSVDLVDGQVFVRERRDIETAIMFESHKFFTISRFGENFGIGPFVAASLSDEEGANPLSKFGAGLMMGWRKPQSQYSWNVGLAWVVDTDSVELRPGVQDGQPTEVTDTNNLTRTTDREGVMLIFSAAW